MMSSVPQISSSPPTLPHMYSEELQLKLYQAFIFSIPILFSIILFLLFYLFYLKRRASSFSPHLLPRINIPPTTYRYYSSSSVSSFIITFHLVYLVSNNTKVEIFSCQVSFLLSYFFAPYKLIQSSYMVLIISQPRRLDLTVQFLDKLPRVLFDEDLQARDSL